MGKIEEYSALLTDMLQGYEQSDNPLETHVIIDDKHHHYQVLRMGWADKDTLVMRIILYFQIKPDGKIWILANWTEDEVADMLVERGVAKSDIVIGLLPEYARPHTGFAVA